jgi:hypothetical protein
MKDTIRSITAVAALCVSMGSRAAEVKSLETGPERLKRRYLTTAIRKSSIQESGKRGAMQGALTGGTLAGGSHGW